MSTLLDWVPDAHIEFAHFEASTRSSGRVMDFLCEITNWSIFTSVLRNPLRVLLKKCDGMLLYPLWVTDLAMRIWWFRRQSLLPSEFRLGTARSRSLNEFLRCGQTTGQQKQGDFRMPRQLSAAGNALILWICLGGIAFSETFLP
jgi:hypothetical protein